MYLKTYFSTENTHILTTASQNLKTNLTTYLETYLKTYLKTYIKTYLKQYFEMHRVGKEIIVSLATGTKVRVFWVCAFCILL